MGGSDDNRRDARVGSAISDNGNTGNDADALGVGSDAGKILPPTSGESDGEPPEESDPLLWQKPESLKQE